MNQYLKYYINTKKLWGGNLECLGIDIKLKISDLEYGYVAN